MELYVDSCDLEAIRKVAEYYPIDGFTTNPGILTQTTRPMTKVMREFRDYARKENLKVFVQVTAETADGMLHQAELCRDYFGKHLVIKIPAVKEGYKAIRICREAGIPVLCTVIHSMTQALIAAKAGAEYVAPYVSHIDNIGADGIAAVRDMVTVFRESGYPCKVLGASFRNADQIKRLALVGCQAVTLPPSFFDLLVNHPSTDESMKGFQNIWKAHFGDLELDDFLKEP
jgi:fructose-6-phosphate aldolase 2